MCGRFARPLGLVGAAACVNERSRSGYIGDNRRHRESGAAHHPPPGESPAPPPSCLFRYLRAMCATAFLALFLVVNITTPPGLRWLWLKGRSSPSFFFCFSSSRLGSLPFLSGGLLGPPLAFRVAQFHSSATSNQFYPFFNRHRHYHRHLIPRRKNPGEDDR